MGKKILIGVLILIPVAVGGYFLWKYFSNAEAAKVAAANAALNQTTK